MRLALALSWFALLRLVDASYHLTREYSGQSFFSGWNFIADWDRLTHGDVNYLGQQDASSQHLAFVSDINTAIMKVDNSSNVPYNNKRSSVRIESTDFYGVGSLFIIDALHMPFGCSVWPAIWTKGAKWPDDGEVDIMEGVNLMTSNQMALHTTPGCLHETPGDQEGTSGFKDCSKGSGCTVLEKKSNSYGAGFADAHGGVFAAQFDVSGLYIWFWSRPDIPDSIKQANSTSSIDTSSWGTPSASYPTTSSCGITNFFGPQQLVIDITLCGDWAGVQGIYQSTCQTTPTGNCTADNVFGPGSPRYDDAYFEIQYIRAYSASNSTSGSSTTGDPSSAAGAPATTTSSAAAGLQWMMASNELLMGLLSVATAGSLGLFLF